jgi:hypothetical protein
MLAWVTMAFIVLITLHFRYTLYKFALLIPGMSGIRAVCRIILMVLFPLSIIIGVITTKLSDKILSSRTYIKTAMFFIIILIISLDQSVVISNFHSYSKFDSQTRLKAIENIARRKNPTAKVFAYMPQKSTDPPYVIHLDAMMASQNLNMATVNGYSGKFPPGYIGYFFEHYDRCDSYLAWMNSSPLNNYASANRYNLFKNIVIIGRDTCF